MRLIDADKLKVYHGINVGANYGGLRTIVFKRDIDNAPTIDAVMVYKRDIDNAPTVDAVPVVRCEDCKCKDKYENFCRRFLREIDPNDYCSYAERRTDETN